MSFPIIPKYNSIATSPNAPLTSDLQLAELGVNTQTGKVYLKGNSGVVEVASDKVASSQLTTAAVAGGVPQLDGSGHISTAQIAPLTTVQVAFLTTTAVANLVPQLDGSGKIPSGLLPSAALGALTYKGSWSVNTSPVIASGGVVGGGTAAKGDYYIAANSLTVGTAIDGHTQFLAGDMLAFNGATWDLIHGANSEVISVAGVTPVNGNVALTAGDIGAVSTAQLTQLATPSGVPQLTSAGTISTTQLQLATTAQIGVLSVGDNLSIDGNGRLSAIQGTYTLPKATTTVLGGIKASDSINVDGNGVATVASAGTY